MLKKLDTSEKFKISCLTSEDLKLKHLWTSHGTSACSLSKIIKNVEKRKNKVTHVKIDGKVPPDLQRIIPDATHLCIREIKEDQVEAVAQRQVQRLSLCNQ